MFSDKLSFLFVGFIKYKTANAVDLVESNKVKRVKVLVKAGEYGKNIIYRYKFETLAIDY